MTESAHLLLSDLVDCKWMKMFFLSAKNVRVMKSAKYLVVWSIKCQEVIKVSFHKLKMTSLSVMFCPQSKDGQFTVIEE